MSTVRPRIASAIARNRSVKSAPRRLQTFERSSSFRTRMRKPSCLISCSQPAPAGGRSTSVGSQGRTNRLSGIVASGPGRRPPFADILLSSRHVRDRRLRPHGGRQGALRQARHAAASRRRPEPRLQAGRRQSENLMRSLVPDWSARTHARFVQDAGCDIDEKQQAIKAASHPAPTSMNVSWLLEIAMLRYVGASVDANRRTESPATI
jgi:hypothetical protein